MRSYRFAEFDFEADVPSLRRHDDVVDLGPTPLSLLSFLIQHRDRVVSIDEVQQAVWPDVFVSDAALASTLRRLRLALGDSGSEQRWIKTYRGRGLRFTGNGNAVDVQGISVDELLAKVDRAKRLRDWVSVRSHLEHSLAQSEFDAETRSQLELDLAMAQAWTKDSDGALSTALRASRALEPGRGPHRAAEFLADAADAVWDAMAHPAAWRLAAEGLSLLGDQRDAVWARLKTHDIAAREYGEPELGGAPKTGDRAELAKVVLDCDPPLRSTSMVWLFLPYASRDEAIQFASHSPGVLGFWIGDFSRSVEIYTPAARRYREDGGIAQAAILYCALAQLHTAQGQMREAQCALDNALEIEGQLQDSATQGLRDAAPHLTYHLASARNDIAFVRGRHFGRQRPDRDKRLSPGRRSWVMATPTAIEAEQVAAFGEREIALEMIDLILPSLNAVPGWSFSYSRGIHAAGATLFEADDPSRAPELEALLREKSLAPDFRAPLASNELTLARLLSLQGRIDEACGAFEAARKTLEEMSAAPLRAMVDYDEARMWLRSGSKDAGASSRAKALIELAREAFRWIGMPGWMERIEALSV